MDLQEFKANYYFFKPEEFGKIFVFVDFGNVRPWAKDFWPEENKYRISVEIDIEKLSSLCGLVKPDEKFFYYGFFPENPSLGKDHEINIRHFKSIFRIAKARKCGFNVRTKEVKMIPNYDETGRYIGKLPKCNFDVEITMDAITKIEKYDTIMLFSGDSDFGKLLRYLKSKKKRVIVVSTRNCMSTELEEVKDLFIPDETLKTFLDYRNKNTPPFRAEA